MFFLIFRNLYLRAMKMEVLQDLSNTLAKNLARVTKRREEIQVVLAIRGLIIRS